VSAPLQHDAAFRYTESSQAAYHYLGARLHKPVANPTQQVFTHWSADRTTSRRVAIGSGVSDLAALVRFDGSPQSLHDFIQAGRRGASIEYFPSLAEPWLSFPCELVEASPIRSDASFWHARRFESDVVLRRVDGGSWQALLEAPFFYWRAGNLPVGLSFTRAGATATEIDEFGVLTALAANILRTDHLDLDGDGIRGDVAVPLERASQNEFLHSESLGNAAWTKVAASIVADQAVGPDGLASLDEIVEDSANATHHAHQPATGMTADANYAVSGFYRENTRGFVRLVISETAAAANFVQAWFDLSDGSVGTTAAGGTGTFVRAYVEDFGGGLYRCVLVGSVANSATAISGSARLATADGVGSYQGDGASSIYGGFMQLEDATPAATSYITTTTVAVARGVEFFQVQGIQWTPQSIVAAGGFTGYMKWVERGTAFTGATALYWNAGGTTDRIVLFSSATDRQLIGQFSMTGSASAQSIANSAVTLNATMEARVVVFLDGSDWKVQLHYSVNGAAEVSATAATIGASLPAAFDEDDITLNSLHAGTSPGICHHEALKLQPGNLSMAECRSL
jgi:hypothetical protein